MAPPVVDVGYVQGRSDNLPKVDAFMLLEFAQTSEDYISAEVRYIRSDRAMRESYTSSAVGRVCLRRVGDVCTVEVEVCPEPRQHNKNYHVSMVVNEKSETVTQLQCHDCVASQGGCKHAIAFLMWINEKTSQPSPTEVASYWEKPKLSNISASAELRTKDFGEVQSKTAVDKQKFFLSALPPPHPVDSMFQRYHTNFISIEHLDLRQMCIDYVISKINEDDVSSSDFLEFCKLSMNEEACETAVQISKDQTDSRHWHLLRYGRITASSLYTAAHSKKDNGGVLKELILGALTLHLSRAMKRGIMLESQVLKVVKKEKVVKIDFNCLRDFQSSGHLLMDCPKNM